MTGDSGAPRESMKERLYLFGIRQLALVAAVVVIGIIFVVEGAVAGQTENLVAGIIIVLIGVGLGYGFKTTAVRRVSKRYYSTDTIVGKEGVAKSGFDAGNKGVVYVDNEYWSAVTSDRISEGDSVTVVSVVSDKVTLRVRKGGA